MRKRLLSLLFAGALVASVATVGVSAATDAEGRYEHTDPKVNTRRVWFYMPSDWYNDFSKQTGDTAGMYWWGGTGSGNPWCGYKTYADSASQMFYVDLPADVPMVIWNNYVNGEMDTEAPIYKAAFQTVDIPSEGIGKDDDSVYLEQEGFWEEMKESFKGDKSALGNFADTFENNEDFGFMLNLDNMIYVLDDNTRYVSMSALSGKLGYSGQWYFYFGDGTYGSWPSPERSKEEMAKGNGVFGELKYVHTPLNEAGFKEVDGEKYYYYLTGDGEVVYGQRAKNGFFTKDGKIYYAQENGNLLRNTERSFTEEEAVDIFGNKVDGLVAGETYTFDADGVLKLKEGQGGIGVEEHTEPPTKAPVETTAPAAEDTTKGTIPTPPADATSATETKGSASSDTASKTNTTTTGGTTTDNAAIQTGTYSMAAVIFLVLAAFVGFAFYSRRKYNK
ncbi:MAG: hypothetical protein IIZ07_08250 [Ruminococcus sp.]|nr:hypothetical protein [Ruminococcus sp.]